MGVNEIEQRLAIGGRSAQQFAPILDGLRAQRRLVAQILLVDTGNGRQLAREAHPETAIALCIAMAASAISSTIMVTIRQFLIARI